MDSLDKQASPGAPPVVHLSNEGGALAQFLPENSVNKETAPAVTAETDGAALGQFLRLARERRGLSLQQISDETKIPSRRLEALEQGNLAALPDGFYGRSEVRAYAEMVHVDPNVALARLERALGTPAAPEAARETQPAEPAARVSGKALAAIGVTAAAVLVWFAAWGRSTSAPDNGIRARTVLQTQRPESPAPQAQVPVNLVAGTSGQAPADQAHTRLPIAQAPTRLPLDQPTVPSPVDRAGTLAPDSEDDSSPQSDSEGELIVTTEPAGSRVTVDGIGWGTTPVTIRNLPFGAKRIRVTKDGYGVEERVVRLTPNRSTITLQIPLRGAP